MRIRLHLAATCLIATCLVACGPADTAPTRPTGTVVILTGGDPTLPIPVLGTSNGSNADLADQMFLRLAGMSSSLRTAGDDAMTPQLASGWRRVDSITVLFDLDRRARWHDGQAVTADDVVFTWQLMQNPEVVTNTTPYAAIAAVEAVDQHTVQVSYRQPFSEQVYLAGFNIQPLPAHLLRDINPVDIATSDFAAQPVGNGPFRWGRRAAGQFVELDADPDFFLGSPGVARVVFQSAHSEEARLNLLLAGSVDVLPAVPQTAEAQIDEHPDYRILQVPNNLVMYMLFNTRSPADTARPHPALSDLRVRDALGYALDRQTMARAVFGEGVVVPEAVQSQILLWAASGNEAGVGYDPERARTLLREAGWVDTNGDGIVDRGGMPLRLVMIYPASSGYRHSLAIQAERMWNAVGVAVTLDRIEFALYGDRRLSGRWDIELGATEQQPTPSSLVQSWSCASARTPGSSNIARWCDPDFDSLLMTAGRSSNPTAAYGAAMARMAEQRPAIPAAAPTNKVAVHSRFESVIIQPARAWTDVWRWKIRPGAELPRDN